MSSHHFVREGQEPALFILEATHYSVAEGLLEWAPLVIVAESALEEVLLWGIKIDVVLAASDHTGTLVERLADQAPIKIFSAGDDVVTTGLQLLGTMGETAVAILTSDFSETIRHKVEIIGHRLQVTVKAEGRKWIFVSSGSFKKWYQASSVIHFSDKEIAGRIPGLKPLNEGFEVPEDQWISIQNPKPFWIGEML